MEISGKVFTTPMFPKMTNAFKADHIFNVKTGVT